MADGIGDLAAADAYVLQHRVGQVRQTADCRAGATPVVEPLERGGQDGGNAVADALIFAARSIEGNGIEGTRRVIDISGDGPNTLGRMVSDVRAEVVAREITINALVLDRPEMPDLPDYFRSYVIGGPGAFAIDANDHESFAAAILKKMLSEIVEAPDQRSGTTKSAILRRTGTTSYLGMR